MAHGSAPSERSQDQLVILRSNSSAELPVVIGKEVLPSNIEEPEAVEGVAIYELEVAQAIDGFRALFDDLFKRMVPSEHAETYTHQLPAVTETEPPEEESESYRYFVAVGKSPSLEGVHFTDVTQAQAPYTLRTGEIKKIGIEQLAEMAAKSVEIGVGIGLPARPPKPGQIEREELMSNIQMLTKEESGGFLSKIKKLILG